MLHGLAKQLIGVVGKTVPATPVTAGSQLRPPLLGLLPKKFTVPTAMEPPAVWPFASMIAPVGMVARPRELLKARNDSQLSVSYITPPPPRTTVRPVPETSQANPNRGAKSLWSPLYGAPMPLPT